MLELIPMTFKPDVTKPIIVGINNREASCSLGILSNVDNSLTTIGFSIGDRTTKPYKISSIKRKVGLSPTDYDLFTTYLSKNPTVTDIFMWENTQEFSRLASITYDQYDLPRSRGLIRQQTGEMTLSDYTVFFRYAYSEEEYNGVKFLVLTLNEFADGDSYYLIFKQDENNPLSTTCLPFLFNVGVGLTTAYDYILNINLNDEYIKSLMTLEGFYSQLAEKLNIGSKSARIPVTLYFNIKDNYGNRVTSLDYNVGGDTGSANKIELKRNNDNYIYQGNFSQVLHTQASFQGFSASFKPTSGARAGEKFITNELPDPSNPLATNPLERTKLKTLIDGIYDMIDKAVNKPLLADHVEGYTSHIVQQISCHSSCHYSCHSSCHQAECGARINR